MTPNIGVFYFLICLLNFSTVMANDSFKLANKLYDDQKYEEAIEQYELLIKDGKIATDVYYNLGNAYFKNDEIAPAILNYERALKFDPSNEDAAFNLKIANSKTIDKVEALPSLFIENAWQTFVTSKSVDGWAMLSIISIFVALLFFVGYLFSPQVVIKKIGFYGGVLIVVVSLFTWLMAHQHSSLLKNKTDAIVFVNISSVMSEPNEKSNKLFSMHEGLKVNLLDKKNGWSKIKIQNGNVGWVKSEEIKEI
ncbi:MAG: tetratricopeptide repeat protein [Vicingaceae bacterium]|nr:tetratricopeptide repeat protein [Vicingaceae bacterium]